VEFILKDVGVAVKQYEGFDNEGIVFGRPDQIELDLIIKNGRIIVAEIKSSVSKADISIFEKKIAFYEKDTGERVTEKIIISPFIDPRGARQLAQKLNIRLLTHPENL